MPRERTNQFIRGEVDLEPGDEADSGEAWNVLRHVQGLQERGGGGMPSIVRWIAALVAVALLLVLLCIYLITRRP